MKIEPKRTLQITIWRSKPERQSRGLSNDLQTSARKASRSPCGGKAVTGIAA
jgi:proline racemase